MEKGDLKRVKSKKKRNNSNCIIQDDMRAVMFYDGCVQ